MITVIIPAYNRPDDLRKALTSLSAQTARDPFSVMVSDDASKDDLRAVCNEFKRTLKIKYIRMTKNGGCGANRRFALNELYRHPTEYVMFMDSDDLLMPQAIERLYQVIKHNQADLVSSDIVQEIEEDGEIHHTYIEAIESKTWLHGKLYRTAFLQENLINFSAELKTNEDLAFNLSIYAHNPESYYINEGLYLWRRNMNSITRSKEETPAQMRCRSVDYIGAMWEAYVHYVNKMSVLMINNILNCYTYWQNATIFGYVDDTLRTKMFTMLHHPEVEHAIVNLYNMPEVDLHLKQWIVKDESLVFYGQTFGAWIMTFFTQEQIMKLIKENKN